MQVGAEEKGQGVWERCGNAGKNKKRETDTFLAAPERVWCGFFFSLTPVNGQRWSVRRGLGRAPGKGVRRGWKLSQAQASELHSRAAG